ncbi:hypothetical protein BDA96_01G278400 [Sorghum bicolor]|uniref:Uncharacterized protein n=1 Tax=Sorghum bicolor TaxID=4558 RepID=A0A921V035_SORBI|nr:hypothetical protein BDA96_01G278400 [Sorghum bicolor]
MIGACFGMKRGKYLYTIKTKQRHQTKQKGAPNSEIRRRDWRWFVTDQPSAVADRSATSLLACARLKMGRTDRDKSREGWSVVVRQSDTNRGSGRRRRLDSHARLPTRWPHGDGSFGRHFDLTPGAGHNREESRNTPVILAILFYFCLYNVSPVSFSLFLLPSKYFLSRKFTQRHAPASL